MLKLITIPDVVLNMVYEGLKKIHKQQNKDMETNKRLLRKRIDKIDKVIKKAFESGMHRFSQGLQKNIEELDIVFRTLLKSVFAKFNRYVWLCV